MKQFITIFNFELKEFIKTKGFIVTTVIICALSVIVLCLPMFLGEVNSQDAKEDATFMEKETYVIYDKEKILDETSFSYFFPNAKIVEANSKSELQDVVEEGKADAGFVIHDVLNFTYYVENSDMMDVRPQMFSEMLALNYKNRYLMELGVESQDALMISSAHATYDSISLGSDGANNISYTFILLFAIYMIIILYGSIIATAVASEKGNRTMELLVTSANSTALIFGKVLAGCAAACLQVGLFLGSAYVTYTFTQEAWNGMLDIIFNIPAEVLIAFAIFGIFGFIFYAFIFGALGALVSKSEDVNSSVTPITIGFIIVYIVVYIGIMDPDSIIFKLASFIPFSSPMAMFARMAMTGVSMIEVIISFMILIVSTILVGWGASKIYRRATLMYGNQIKLRHAFKWLGKKNV